MSTAVATGAAANGGTATATQQTTTQTAQAPWYGDLSSDPDLKGWAELKKLDSPVAALKYGRDTEKFVGVPKDQLLRLPGPDAKPEDWNPVFDRLGRPAKPEDYQIPAVEGGEEFANLAKAQLHKIGLTSSQATALATWWNEYMTTGAAKLDAAETQEAAIAAEEQKRVETEDIAALHREWGEQYPAREEMGRRAFRQLVAPFAGEKAAEFMDKMEGALGTGNFLRFMANIGAKLGEHPFVAGESDQNFNLTPAAARAQLEEKKQDREWMKKVYQNPKGPEGREWDRLITVAARAQGA